MIIQVAYTFYLDFLLPRMDAPEPFTIQINLPEYSAYVMGWNREKEDLFHGEAGLSMQSMTFSIKPADRKSGTLVYRMSDRIIDRIQVALEWEAESAPEVTEEVSLAWQERAVRLTNDILAHLRIATGSMTIRRIDQSWNPQEGKFEIGVPHSEAWFVKDDNTPIVTYSGFNTNSGSGAIRMPETGALCWSDLCASVSKGYAPLHLTLLFEAEDSLRLLAARNSVLSIASSCEMQGESIVENQSLLSKTAARRIVSPRDGVSFGTRYFHDLTERVYGRSLRRENSTLFGEVDAAYSERNKLMHTGRFSRSFAEISPSVQYRTIQGWIDSARRLSQWADGLSIES